MDKEEFIHTKVLKDISTYLIIPLFTITLLDIIKNISSNLSTSSSLNEKL